MSAICDSERAAHRLGAAFYSLVPPTVDDDHAEDRR